MQNFKSLDANQLGLYTSSKNEFETVSALDCLLITFKEMNELVKKSFLFSEDKIQQLRENNTEQITLRMKVEELT